MIVNLNTPVIDKYSRKKISKDIAEQNSTIS